MSLTKLSWRGIFLIIPGQGEFGKWHPGWGRENRWLFLQCGGQIFPETPVANFPRVATFPPVSMRPASNCRPCQRHWWSTKTTQYYLNKTWKNILFKHFSRLPSVSLTQWAANIFKNFRKKFKMALLYSISRTWGGGGFMKKSEMKNLLELSF